VEKPAPVIRGELRDYLLEAGQFPAADPRREYIAGGDPSFPLVGQLELSHNVDDLALDLGMRVYEQMLNDPTVSGALHILITGILSGQFQVVPAVKPDDGEEVEPGSDREQEIEAARVEAEFCKRSFRRLKVPIKSILYDLLLGSFSLGCKLAEKVFEDGDGEDAGQIVLKTLRVKRNQSWNFVVDPPGNIVAVRALCFDVGLHDLPPDKFMVCTWMPRNSDPRGRSLLRGAYNGWNLKLNAWPLYFAYLEVFGSPTAVGIAAPAGPDEAQRDERGKPTGVMLAPTEALGEAMAMLRKCGYIAVPNGADVKFCQAVGNGEAFEKFFALTKNEILEGILHSARAMLESKRNSQADADQAQDVVGNIMIFGREWAELLLGGRRGSLCHQLVELNKGTEYANKYAPHVSLGQIEHQDVAKAAVAYAALGYQIEPFQSRAIDAKLSLPVRENVTTPVDPPPSSDPVVSTKPKVAQFAEGEDGADPFSRLRTSFGEHSSRPGKPRRTRPARSRPMAAGRRSPH
jgi:hypothetical protein